MKYPCLLFIGDSLVDFGNWPHRLPDYRVISSGMPGEQAEELLWRLPVPCASPPEAVILMTGTNNLFFGDTKFCITIEQIVHSLRQEHPHSAIIITSLLPFRVQGIQPVVLQVNGEFKDIAARTGSHYLDLFSAFEISELNLFDYDGVHLSEAGYQLWADRLTEFLPTTLAKESD